MTVAYMTGAPPLSNAILGRIPSPLFGDTPPVGDEVPFKDLPVGTTYHCLPEDYHTQIWVKVEDRKHERDWIIQEGIIRRTVSLSDFTDGGAATGTVVLGPTIPFGAVVERSHVRVGIAFDATATATVQIGDGSDVDRYNTGTPSVATTGAKDMGAPSGAAFHATAVDSVTVTVTEDDDFTDMTTGMMHVTLFYRMG